jgi:hypothetical protein
MFSNDFLIVSKRIMFYYNIKLTYVSVLTAARSLIFPLCIFQIDTYQVMDFKFIFDSWIPEFLAIFYLESQGFKDTGTVVKLVIQQVEVSRKSL